MREAQKSGVVIMPQLFLNSIELSDNPDYTTYPLKT